MIVSLTPRGKKYLHRNIRGEYRYRIDAIVYTGGAQLPGSEYRTCTGTRFTCTQIQPPPNSDPHRFHPWHFSEVRCEECGRITRNLSNLGDRYTTEI